MSHATEIVNESELVNTLQGLVQTTEEVYVIKMGKIRNSVLDTRYFMDNLGQTFTRVRLAYHQLLLTKTGRDKFQFPELKNKTRSVAVLLSASEKLSGEINRKIFEKFWQYLDKNPSSDVVIAGKTGRIIFQQKAVNRPYRFFDIPEEILTVEHLRSIISHLIDYQEVNVFYGKFISFVLQQETRSNISGQSLSDTQSLLPSEKTDTARVIIFEPSPEEILSFFETQIFTSLFKQTINESYLAQIGSRIMVLETASARIESRLKELDKEFKRIQRQKQNKKQLKSLVSTLFNF
jgi:F0F1-type ATP synthase gamma subunit